MLASLVFRNLLRSRKRLLPLIGAIVLTFAGLLLGNAVLTSSNESLYSAYASHIAGDMSVSAAADANFTIFGSDALLVGEYQVPPTLLNFEALQEQVDVLPAVRASVPAVTAAARVEIGSRRNNHIVIGVDFDRYREVFEAFEIVDGRFPETGERAVLVQEGWGSSVVGEPAVLSAAFDTSFAVREAPVVGVFRLPISDEQLERIVITDPVTARALNGYVGGVGTGEIPEEDRSAFESDLDGLFAEPEQHDEAEPDDFEDDLFGEPDDFGEGDEPAFAPEEPAPDPGDGIDPEDPVAALEAFFRSAAEGDGETDEAEATAGVWNFLLISLHERGDMGSVELDLAAAGFSAGEGYRIRNWRGTVGGNAEIAWYLQLMFNVGVLFVAIGAAMITTNALVLSVLERTAEIGTMRALGATRARVSAMIALETAMTVVGAALIGILAGIAGVGLLNAAQVSVDNPYINILFGGEPVNALLSPGLVLGHLAAAFALALIAVAYPLKRALGISPVEAMRE